MANDIVVSIYCAAYNHEKYIEKTLNGFINQKTDFKYQVIVHDDASTDRTAEIIKKYETQYPDVIHAIYQKENQYSQDKDIVKEFILPQITGKYVAICEGDDYWTDSEKLQKQVDALEKHKECFFCVHRVEEVMENEEKTGVLFPPEDIATGVISPQEFLKMTRKYSFHTSSYLFEKKRWVEYQENPPEFKTVCPVGDEAYMLYFAQLGPVYYIQDKMSCYRRGVPSSWSKIQNSGNIVEKKIKINKQMAKTILLYDEFTNHRFHDICCKRYAYYMKTIWLLEGRTKELFESKSRELLKSFPIKHRIVLLLSALFPQVSQKIYREKLFKVNQKKGY